MAKVNHTATKVHTILVELANELGTGTVSPTNKWVAERINRGPREVVRAVNALQENGWISVDIDPLRSPIRLIKVK
jgi:hypothetical protein